MTTRLWIGLAAGLLASAACASDPSSGAPCPEGEGEFPPTHCAYLEGRLTAAGAPVAGAGLRVDDVVYPTGYAYLSDAVETDARGRFRLIVYRINQFGPLTVPDKASRYVKLYQSLAAATEGAGAQDSFLVLMTFAPMGTPVDTTEAELTAATGAPGT